MPILRCWRYLSLWKRMQWCIIWKRMALYRSRIMVCTLLLTSVPYCSQKTWKNSLDWAVKRCVIQYKGINWLLIQKEEPFNQGYAVCFENIVRYVNALLPSSEDVNAVPLSTTSKFPLPTAREVIANSLIHQDLYITGTTPVVEIFDNRIEVTNPGTSLVDVLRIIDNPPKSRNEKQASLMRRLKMCEELGRDGTGWCCKQVTQR